MRLIDITGEKFGDWTVINKALPLGSRTMWRCRCSCGAYRDICGYNLRHGRSTMCTQCVGKRLISVQQTTHAMSTTRVYKHWQMWKIRCYTKTHPSYRHYGAKGIRVHEPWVNDFEAFYAYVGEPPTSRHTLGRLDKSGDLCPGNIFWADIHERINPRRKTT
jgi:hypothetical protein